MTRKNAVLYAINTLENMPADIAVNPEVVPVLYNLYNQLAKTRPVTEEKKAERKAANAAARIALMQEVIPVLTAALKGSDGLTAKELYEVCKDKLPENFSTSKVQAVLLRELKGEVDVIEGTKHAPANRYRM